MPNRILKDSICTSDNLDALTPEQEVFWYRLLVQCDDYGRMDARPAILRARCYPLKLDLIREADVAKWISALEDAGLITLYVVAGKPYLQVATWDKHQQVRARRSKYPDMISGDITCKQTISDAPENPIQSEYDNESESDNESKTTPVVGRGRPSDAEAGKVFTVWEQEIGMLSPSIKDAVDDMLNDYAPAWIIDAAKEAAANNKRTLKYVRGILANWQREGRGYKPGRNGSKPEPPATADERAAKYVPKGYEDLVEH